MLKPLYRETVHYQAMATARDPRRNVDKVYIVEMVEREGEPYERTFVARARYGRNDGRKLRMIEIYATGSSPYTARWMAKDRMTEKASSYTPGGRRRRVSPEYTVVTDPLLCAVMVAADNARQRIEQVSAEEAHDATA